VIEYYINELISQGITYIPPWKGPGTQAVRIADDTPSQDSGMRSRSNSSSHSHSSQSSLVLGATAASICSDKPINAEVPTSPEKNVGKLEDVYIERFLGSLTPVQESRLVQLRQWLQDTHKGKVKHWLM